MARVKQKRDTEENRAYWEGLERMAREAREADPLPARLAAQWEELDTRINLLPRYYADGTTPNGGQPMVRLHDVLMLVRKRAALLVGVEPQETL